MNLGGLLKKAKAALGLDDEYEPGKLGLPALPPEIDTQDPDDETREKQDEWIKDTVGKNIWFKKDDRVVCIKLIPQMVEFLADLFFGRWDEDLGDYVTQVILWKNRGGGGSLCAAVLIFLCMVYRRKSFTDMAGSGKQAKRLYNYTKDFWFCKKTLPKLLEKEPLQTETKLRTGVVLECLAASDKQARGGHNPGFIGDEGCSEDARVGKVLESGINSVTSEPGSLVVLLSTFHVLSPFWTDHWDNAKAKGYKRFRWNIYDVMEQCTTGISDSTAKDPLALRYCQTKCPLTEREPVQDAEGNVTGWKFTGCNGRARLSNGFTPRQNVLKSKRRTSTDTWKTEFECERPGSGGTIYSIPRIEAAETDSLKIPGPKVEAPRSVGIDWGFAGECFVCGPCVLWDGMVSVVQELAVSHWPTEEIIKHLKFLRQTYGPFIVFADSSHPYNNHDLQAAGFDVVPVVFGKWKSYGIDNCSKWLDHSRVRFLRSKLPTFLKQVKGYLKGPDGKPVKKDDHGPDAWMCAMLNFIFNDVFQSELEESEEKGKRKNVQVF